MVLRTIKSPLTDLCSPTESCSVEMQMQALRKVAWEDKRLEEKHIFLSVIMLIKVLILLFILVLVLILVVSLEFFIHEVPLFHFSSCWQILVQALCVVQQLLYLSSE